MASSSNSANRAASLTCPLTHDYFEMAMTVDCRNQHTFSFRALQKTLGITLPSQNFFAECPLENCRGPISMAWPNLPIDRAVDELRQMALPASSNPLSQKSSFTCTLKNEASLLQFENTTEGAIKNFSLCKLQQKQIYRVDIYFSDSSMCEQTAAHLADDFGWNFRRFNDFMILETQEVLVARAVLKYLAKNASLSTQDQEKLATYQRNILSM